MKHEEAIKMNAAEGYLLDDLTDTEREAFEEHFADCESCFADVRDGATFTTVLRNEIGYDEVVDHGHHHAGYRVAYAAAAAAVLSFGALGYQQFAVVAPLRAQLAGVRRPQIEPLYELRDIRAEEQTITVDGRSHSTLEFVVPPDIDSPPYTCKIVDAHSREVPIDPITAEQARTPVRLHLAPGSLAPGDYSLVVSGARAVPVFEKRFTVR